MLEEKWDLIYIFKIFFCDPSGILATWVAAYDVDEDDDDIT